MVEQEPKDNRRCRKMFDGIKTGRANDFQRISNQSRPLLKGSEDVVRTSRTFLSNSSSETQGQLVGTGKSLKRAKKIREKKSQEREEEPLQTENLDLLATPFGQALRALAMTCAHFGRNQIYTQVKASFSPFGHPTQVNASGVTSVNLLLANQIEDSLP